MELKSKEGYKIASSPDTILYKRDISPDLKPQKNHCSACRRPKGVS